MLHLEYIYLWCWKLDTLEIRSEIPENIWNIVLEMEGEDELDELYEKWRSITYSPEVDEYTMCNKKKKG